MEPGGQQFNLQELLQQAQRVQEQLVSAQQELAEAEVTGTSGGGLVEATINGQGEVTRVTIDPKAIDPDDIADTAETLGDLVVAALRDAKRGVEELQAEKMGPLAEGFGGGMPGMGGPGELPGGLPGGGLPGGFPGLGGPGGA